MIPDPIVTFDNGQLHVVMTAVDQTSWAERVRRLKIETCDSCGCRLRMPDILCRDCAAEQLADCSDEAADDSDN